MNRDEMVTNLDAILARIEAAFHNGADHMEDMEWNWLVTETLHAAATLLREDAATMDAASATINALWAKIERLRAEIAANAERGGDPADTRRLDALIELAQNAERIPGGNPGMAYLIYGADGMWAVSTWPHQYESFRNDELGDSVRQLRSASRDPRAAIDAATMQSPQEESRDEPE